MANSIEKIPVPLIFKKVVKDDLSGELTITTDTFIKKLFFIDGRLEFATSTLEKERLGDILVARNQLTQEQLQKLKRIKENSNRKTGEVATQISQLNMGDIFRAILHQVRTITVNVFSITQGEWQFINASPRIPNNQRLKLKTVELLSEGVKHIKDFTYYKKRFFYRAPVTSAIPENLASLLSPAEIKFYANLMKFPNTAVERIFTHSSLPDDVFWRNLVLLYLLNIIDFAEFTVDHKKNKEIEELDDYYRKLKSEGLDLYYLLGLGADASDSEVKEKYNDFSSKYRPERLNVAPDSSTVMKAEAVLAEIQRGLAEAGAQKDKQIRDLDAYYQKLKDQRLDLYQVLEVRPDAPDAEIKEKYLNFSRKYHPDRLNVPPDSSIAMKANAVLAEINRAFETLGKKDKRMQYDLKGHQEEDKHIPSKQDRVKSARALYLKANHLHKQGVYWEAASLAEQATQLDPTKASYFLLLGVSQAKVTTLQQRAEESLQKAAAMEPWNADPVFALGKLYQDANLNQKAEACFKKALEINMEHTLAGQAMDQIDFTNPKKNPFSFFKKK